MYDKLKDSLKKIENLEVKFDFPLKEYTSFKIGGNVDVLAIPSSPEALKELLALINKTKIPVFILGKGSNIIVGDKGYRGIVIYTSNLDKVSINEKIITAEAGITLASLANKALDAELSGLEFASGIPGTLGGALYMNAGAYDGEMKDVISEATLYTYQGEKITLKKEELGLAYRYSILQEKNLIAVKTKLLLQKGKKEDIKAKMKDLNQRRKDKQPLEWPSAGSIFKRPTGYYSGPLIEGAGLKGLRVGDAEVSEKHAGFIINRGNASAADVRELISKVQEEVYKRNGVKLEVEPRFIGEF
ncbi:UDP-N-acetylmuramate dehydrogenase [Natronospora cellulosivora (SeqCode)]